MYRLLVLLWLLPLTACADTLAFLTGEDQAAIATQAQWQGQNALSQAPLTLTAREASGWQAIKNQLHPKDAALLPAALPKGQMAVAVFLGTRSNGCYGVEIIRTERRFAAGERDELAVIYQERAPKANALCSQALTSPWAIKFVTASPQQPNFEKIHTQ